MRKIQCLAKEAKETIDVEHIRIRRDEVEESNIERKQMTL